DDGVGPAPSGLVVFLMAKAQDVALGWVVSGRWPGGISPVASGSCRRPGSLIFEISPSPAAFIIPVRSTPLRVCWCPARSPEISRDLLRGLKRIRRKKPFAPRHHVVSRGRKLRDAAAVPPKQPAVIPL